MKKKINQIVFSLLFISFCFCGYASAEIIDKIVAIVDNDIITLVDLNKETAPYLKNMDTSGYSDEKKKEMKDVIDKKILNAMVDQSLTRQEAKKYDIKVSDTQIDNAVKNVMKNKALSREEFNAALAKEGLTLKEYRANIKKQILQAKLINHVIKSKVIITDIDIKNKYNSEKNKYSGKKKYHLRNILMDNKNDILKIKKQLGGEKKFISFARQYSIAPNAQDGGDLGFFDINNFSQTIKDSISKLDRGMCTNVISTPQGFQIFYIEDIVLKGAKTLAQAHDEIHETLYREQVEKKFKAWLESLKKKAHIKIML